jgi:hypothetical protein
VTSYIVGMSTPRCTDCGGNGKKDGSGFKHARPCKACAGTGACATRIEPANMTRGEVNKALDKAEPVRDQALAALFDAALHGDERISEIKERLGRTHPIVVQAEEAEDAFWKLRARVTSILGFDARRA